MKNDYQAQEELQSATERAALEAFRPGPALSRSSAGRVAGVITVLMILVWIGFGLAVLVGK